MERLKIFTQNKKRYSHLSVNLYADDYENLIKALNRIAHNYTSMAHFSRAAINEKLESLDCTFRVLEK